MGIPRRHDHPRAVDIDNLAGGAALARQHLRAGNGQHRACRACKFCRGQGVPIGPKIQATDQRADLYCGLGKVDQPAVLWPSVLREIAALAEVLGGALQLAAFQLGQHCAKAFHPGGVAFGVETKGRFIGRDLYLSLRQQVAGINTRFDQMPTDPMPHLAVDDCPGGRVQPSIARQGPIVEIDRATCGQGQNRLRDQPQVGDAQKPVGGQTHGQQIFRIAAEDQP